MKFKLIPVLLLAWACSTSAQNFDLKLNAGANATQINKFQNKLTIVDAFIVPGLYTVENAKNTPQVAEPTVATNYKPGFFVDAELGKELWNDWKLSLSLGLQEVSFTYDTRLPANNIINTDTSMKAVIGNYGNTNLLYINSRVANISKTFSRISLQAGPLLSYLVHKKYNNTYLFYSNEDKTNATAGIFEQKGDATKLLLGAHLNLRYKLFTPLEVMIGSQYFFNSIYKKEGTYEPMYKKSKPLQLMIGLSYRVAYF